MRLTNFTPSPAWFRPDNEGTAIHKSSALYRRIGTRSDPTTRGWRLKVFGSKTRRVEKFRPDNEGTARNVVLWDTFAPQQFRPDNEGTATLRCPTSGDAQTWFRPDNEGTATFASNFLISSSSSFRPDNEGMATFQLPFSAQIVGKQFGGDGRMRRCGVQAKGLLRLMLPLYPCTPTRLHAYTPRR